MAGYTSIGDMFDGGGPGTSGSTYSGGGVISDIGNRITGSTSGSTSGSGTVGGNLPGATSPRRRGETQADYEARTSESGSGTYVWGPDLQFVTNNPDTTITEQQYLEGKAAAGLLTFAGGTLGLATNTIVELQRRGLLPASDTSSYPVGGSGGSETDTRVSAILNDPNLTDEQKNAQISDLLKGAVTAEIGQQRADIGLNTVQPMYSSIYGAEGTTDPASVFDNPQSFLSSMSLGSQLPTMDPNAAGTVLNPDDYSIDPSRTNILASTVSDISTANATPTKTAATYDAATATGDVIRYGTATAQQGTVSDKAQVTAAQLDAKGAATGVNADGTVNYTGLALGSAALQGLQVIDTSTVAGKLLAQELGEGNYVDAKATVSGQLEILSKQFVDPVTGEPKIPTWAAGVARNVSRIAAFKGMTGTAATAAMSTALMEASLPIAQDDAKFFQTMTATNLSNRQQMAVQKAQVLANLDMANMDARMTAAVENSKAFLAMDMANLDNRQQTEVVNTQARVQAILEDAKAENASRLFAAESQNDFTKFYDNLNSQIQQFNASQTNEMKRFNVGEINSTAQFNASLENQREQFYKEMQYNVDLANARWRQTVATAETEMKFEAARIDVQNMFNFSTEAMNRMWDREDALLDYAWKSTEGELDRQVQIYAADRNYDVDMTRINNEADAAEGAAWYEAGKLLLRAGNMFDWW